jgi:uncharacterized oxidoreductase
MQPTGNTMLITGGGSGIGRGLAEAFHALGNRVIIAGRRHLLLESVVDANPGMAAVALDVGDAAAVHRVAVQLKRDHPDLNAVIHCAGIMRLESLRSHQLEDAEAMVATNLIGPMRLTAELLSHLENQPQAAILTVTSGLAFVPLSLHPTYCATKAALHSYTQSLRYQLKGSAVEVLEIIPPYVQTELQGPRQASDPRAMPLKDFIAETMNILTTRPELTEICVERVKPLRSAEMNGGYDAIFATLNDTMAAAMAHKGFT